MAKLKVHIPYSLKAELRTNHIPGVCNTGEALSAAPGCISHPQLHVWVTLRSTVVLPTVPNPAKRSDTGYKSRQTVSSYKRLRKTIALEMVPREERKGAAWKRASKYTLPLQKHFMAVLRLGRRTSSCKFFPKWFVCQSSLRAACGTASCESNTRRWNSSAHLGAHYCSTEPLNSVSQVDIAHCH